MRILVRLRSAWFRLSANSCCLLGTLHLLLSESIGNALPTCKAFDVIAESNLCDATAGATMCCTFEERQRSKKQAKGGQLWLVCMSADQPMKAWPSDLDECSRCPPVMLFRFAASPLVATSTLASIVFDCLDRP